MNETYINDWYIELYEDFTCERKEQLLQREGQVIREIVTLNKIISGRTDKEWREDNKEKIKEYKETNKEKLKEKLKAYRETNKEKIKEYQCSTRRDSIAKHKQTLKHRNIMKELAKTQENM